MRLIGSVGILVIVASTDEKCSETVTGGLGGLVDEPPSFSASKSRCPEAVMIRNSYGCVQTDDRELRAFTYDAYSRLRLRRNRLSRKTTEILDRRTMSCGRRLGRVKRARLLLGYGANSMPLQTTTISSHESFEVCE
jgi:hypothetical protein